METPWILKIWMDLGKSAAESSDHKRPMVQRLFPILDLIQSLLKQKLRQIMCPMECLILCCLKSLPNLPL